MERGRNSYYGLATQDLNQAIGTLIYAREYNDYNGVAALCSQSCEKFLKAYVEYNILTQDISILKTHNLRRLISEIKKYNSSCELDEINYKWVGDFYYDARYPGDDFIEVTEEQGIKCIELTKELKEWIDINTEKRPSINLKSISDFL